jgi:hypothetical protein
VFGEKSKTGISNESRNVVTAASKSCTAMAMRGMEVITAAPRTVLDATVRRVTRNPSRWSRAS